MERVFLGIGSNLFNPAKQVRKSLYTLSNCFPYIKFIACSSFYCSHPLDGWSCPDFLNVVVIIDTSFSPIELLNCIQLIEKRQGRVRSNVRWSSRTLDIDILLFGNKAFSIPRLIIPHYDMLRREFFLYPLFELVPNFRFFNGKKLSEYLNILPKNDLQLWDNKSR